ncbi:MAG: hypothetical protein EB006_00990, partial [Betaproteobacteria bacterium]|nr:hypothetical protein [Betaproteobacteria bacterium]
MKRLVDYALREPVFIVLGVLLFIFAGSIAFKNLSVEAFPDVTDSQVTVIVPEAFGNGEALVPGSYQVFVTNTDGTESTATTFTVTSDEPTPGICAITESGDVGESITISGDNFGADTDMVTFATNVTSLAATTWTNDTIAIPVPTGAITAAVPQAKTS